VSSGATRDEIQAFDEGRLSERIMLAAMAHGLGSSIGWFVGPGRDEAGRLLGAPPGSLVRTAISIGYPATGAERGRRRKPLDKIVHYDRYSGEG
jgi:nitroreductase